MSATTQVLFEGFFHNAQEIEIPALVHVLCEDWSPYYKHDPIYRLIWTELLQHQKFVLDGDDKGGPKYLVGFAKCALHVYVVPTQCAQSPMAFLPEIHGKRERERGRAAHRWMDGRMDTWLGS